MERHPFWKEDNFWVLAIIFVMGLVLLFMLWANYRSFDLRDPVTTFAVTFSGLCTWAVKTILTRKITPEKPEK